MSASFTLTVSTTDDDGNRYSSARTLRDLKGMANAAGVTLFSIAFGSGYDDPTDERTEPIIILQGAGHTDDVSTFGDRAAFYAGSALNQRAVGWFTGRADDTYRSTAEWLS